jgi:hypothetical protein
MFIARKQETVLEAKTRALNAPRYGFCNVSSVATKLHGTTQNMSFRPEIVDWACSLRQKKK